MEKTTPQLEDGFTRIANDILDELCKIKLSSYQTRVILFIIRKTYGYNKKEDWISVSQIEEATGIYKAHVSRAKKELLERRIVTSNGNKIAFQKDSKLWRELPIQVTVTNPGKKVTILGEKLPVQVDTKDNIQKKYISINTNRSNDQYGNKYCNFVLDEFKRRVGISPIDSNSRQIAYNVYQLTSSFIKKQGTAYKEKRGVEATFTGLVTKAWEVYLKNNGDHLPQRLKTFKEHYKGMLEKLSISLTA